MSLHTMTSKWGLKASVHDVEKIEIGQVKKLKNKLFTVTINLECEDNEQVAIVLFADKKEKLKLNF